MLANNKLNHHVDALKDSTPKFGNVQNVILDLQMIEIQHSTTHSTSTLVPTTLVTTTSVICTRHAHQLTHVTLQANFKEVQKLAMPANNKLNHHVDALKDSTPIFGDVKSAN